MKKLICMGFLLLMLTGCAKQQAPVPDPEPAPPPAQEEALPPVQSEPAPTPEPEIIPDPPKVEAPQLPELPYPVYCWGDTAVSKDGTVLLQVPDHILELTFDAVSGKPAGILSAPANISWNSLYDGFYTLDGTPVLTDMGMPYFRCFGDLCWYGVPGEYTVQRLSDGTVLEDNLYTVLPVGDCLALQAGYWNDRCKLVDETGQTVLELDRGFRLTAVYKDHGSSYLAMTSAVDGTTSLLSTKGTPVLNEFYKEITDVTLGCAIVWDGAGFQAVSLTTGESVFSWNQAFTLLPDGAIAETNLGSILVDRQGNRLDDRLLDNSPLIYDWNGDGTPEYLLTNTMQDVYSTLVLAPDGTELGTIPMHTISVHALSPTTLAYAEPTGTGALLFEAHLVDLQTGTDTVLTAGKNLYVQPITTSGGQMLLCITDEDSQLFLNDGTPARDDLGICTYLGGDVFACTEGLRCLDGTWLYKPE